jgi:hypothetical protein
MGAHAHSGTLENPAKTHRYGWWVVVQNAKTTGFSGEDGLFKKRGSGTNSQKMQILARKERSLWFLAPEMTRICADSERNDANSC